MKARIRFKSWVDGNARRQKTFEVDKNEPNYIVRRARELKYLGYNDYVIDIKCGRTLYMDYGYAEPKVQRRATLWGEI